MIHALTKHRAISYATWNPSDKSSAVTLSADLLTASHPTTSNYGLARSTVALSGKVYFELIYTSNLTSSGGRVQAAGVCGSSLNATTGQAYLSSDALECWPTESSCWTNGASVGILTGTSTTTLRVAVDATARKVWMAKSGTSSWLLGGDPAAGTTPTATLTGTDSIFAFAEPFSSSGNVKLVSNPANMLNSAPSGFIAGF